MQTLRRGVLRQIAGSIALLGILFYSGLIPGHLVSQARADLVQATLGDALNFICHSPDAAPAIPQKDDGKSQGNCPFCKSFASFQFALADSASIVLKPRATSGVVLPQDAAIAAFRRGQIPLSRGPPSLSV